MSTLTIPLGEGRETSGLRYPAADPRGALLVLAHGAGAAQRHAFMVAAASGLAARGIDVVTFDFPYMHERRGAPDKPPVLEHAFRAAIDAGRALESLKRHRLFIGGKSMGGRMATHLASQGVEGLNGVVVFGYPLHPPGQPGKLRVSHLSAITTRMLIVQGVRDAFGSPDELAPHFESIPAPVVIHTIAAADHSLSVRGKRGPEVFDAMLTMVADWVLAAVRSTTPPFD